MQAQYMNNLFYLNLFLEPTDKFIQKQFMELFYLLKVKHKVTFYNTHLRKTKIRLNPFLNVGTYISTKGGARNVM